MSLKHWFILNVFPNVAARAIRLLGHTLTIEKIGEEHVNDLYMKGHAIIFAFWHGRQLMMPLAYRGRRAYILISQHQDGELIHRIVSHFGLLSVRGSTTRGGSQALRKLVRHGREGADLVITPDGPKGPMWQVHEGVIQLAKLTGLPIVPVTFACSKKNSSPVGMSFSYLSLGVAHSS